MIKISRIEAYQHFNDDDFKYVDGELDKLHKSREGKEMYIQYLIDDVKLCLSVRYNDEQVALYTIKEF